MLLGFILTISLMSAADAKEKTTEKAKKMTTPKIFKPTASSTTAR